MFKVEDKIIVELDIPTISGRIYSKDIAIDMIKKISEQRIFGLINRNPNDLDEKVYENEIKDKETSCWLENARVIVDETEEPAELLLIGDIVFDENKIDEKTLNFIKNGNWRISIIGQGNIDYDKEKDIAIIKEYELMYFNIENVDELYYNIDNVEGEK